MKRLAIALLAVWLPMSSSGCSSAPDLALEIRLPADRRLLAAVTQLNLTATRGSVVLAQQRFSSASGYVSLSGVSHGASTVITLDGVDSAGNVIARGRTCPIDFERAGLSAPLYYAPTNFFAPTAGDPTTVRQRASAAALSSGAVLIAGGSDGTTVLGSSERFTPGSARFAAAGATLNRPRWQAESVLLPSIGVLLTGGLDATGAIADADLYLESQQQFLPISDARLDARVGHRVVVLDDGRAFLSGGSATENGPPLATTLIVYVLSDGTYQVTAGPPLAEARRAHAAVVDDGVPIAIGGQGAAGVLDSIEALDVTATTAAPPIAHLRHARAEATASLLSGGSILVVGGVGSDNAPLATAEVFNRFKSTTTIFQMAAARRGHTATVLSDGRVLVAGGFDAAGNALTSVELFDADIGFVTERSLGQARGNHAAVPLCDGTVLLIGGASGAELYNEPAN